MNKHSEALWDFQSMVEHIDWDAVYTKELPRVYNFFLYKLGDKEFAQDLTATTLERAWKLRSKYRSAIAGISSWLFGIARNVLKEHLRKNRSGGQKLQGITSVEEMSAKIDVEEMVQQQQEKVRLHKILLKLPDREQDLIALKYGAGLTNREIAQVTGLSESNVGSILHRTVNNIRAQLENDDGR
jgi:RNA polymerase sigma-70 factor (ECF subfamily)